MEAVLLIVAAFAGAGAKWLFDRLTSMAGDKKAALADVVAARHQALEAGQAFEIALIKPSAGLREATLAVSQAVDRLIALGDVTGATRVTNWLLTIGLKLSDTEVAAAKSEFMLHMKDRPY